ncbi:hypothetical protein [Nostoc sp.]|uniref:hypothetical protein n=1 Tax=Nostoc sp. TaxID=1180 RepID=UPI002FFAFE64
MADTKGNSRDSRVRPFRYGDPKYPISYLSFLSFLRSPTKNSARQPFFTQIRLFL